jgi:hypothetical protein
MVSILYNIIVGSTASIFIFGIAHILVKGFKVLPNVRRLYAFALIGALLSVVPTLADAIFQVKLTDVACNIFFFNCFINNLTLEGEKLFSLLLNNVIGGISISLFAFEIIYAYTKKAKTAPPLEYFYLFSVLGATIALSPTIVKVMFGLELPGVICDVFFLNCFVQSLDPSGSLMFSTAFFLLFIFGIMVVSKVIKREKGSDSYPSID